MTSTPPPSLAAIIQALTIIHDRATPNTTRREASDFLESQKTSVPRDLAAQNGFLLAIDKGNAPMVRHFGLSLLQHVLAHGCATTTGTNGSANASAANGDDDDDDDDAARAALWRIRGSVLQLTSSLTPADPAYIRNKVALLWVEVAKRIWGLDWWSMDEELVALWSNGGLLYKEFVLTVLETLSEDIIHREDTASSLRGTDLNRKLVEICTPAEVFERVFKIREEARALRCGGEGWLVRVSVFLAECSGNWGSSPMVKTCAMAALGTLTSMLAWAMPQAVEMARAVPNAFAAAATQDEDAVLGALDMLHALYGRTGSSISPTLIGQIFAPEQVQFLQQLYQWSVVGSDDAGEMKYTISKKISELAAYLCSYLEFGDYKISGASMTSFFGFLVDILLHPSLVVSIPILHAFSRILAIDWIANDAIVTTILGPVLEVCTTRMVRYEALPEDAEDPTVVFLNEDIDTPQEKHAFVSNYRKYCTALIDLTVQIRPEEAVSHLLSKVDLQLNKCYEGVEPFDPVKCRKWSVPLVRADTQFCVVEGLLKGFRKWADALGSRPQEDEQRRVILEKAIESWGRSLMERQFDDPHIKQRVLRLSVDISAKALSDKPQFALRVLEHIMVSFVPERPEFPSYSEAVRELNNLATYEVRRLAIRYSDYFSGFYDSLEQKVAEIATVTATPERPGIDLSSVLLMIAQRSRTLDPYMRQSRLRSFVDPIKAAWSSPEFVAAVDSFQSFCETLGLDRVFPYLQAVGAEAIQDWAEIGLTEQGKEIQRGMNARFNQLPIRSTKTMLAVTTDRVKPTEPAHEIACELWRDAIPLILPTVLKLVGNAHAFHNPQSFAGSPDYVRPLIVRVLTDRFWQAGISTGSKEEFYARVASSKDTLEGFSSATRGKVRAVRECCYSIIYSMSRLGAHFYAYEELAAPLAEALFRDAPHLSSHQFSVLLNVTRCIIDDCPARYRGHFLPPMISTLFAQIDKKLTSEWDSVERRKAGAAGTDGNGGNASLTDEMKDESVLRQLTYSAVMEVANFLDPHRQDNDTSTAAEAEQQQEQPESPPAKPDSIRQFVLSSPLILEPVLLFCTHVLRMKDTRCGVVITRVLRSILPEFTPTPDTPTAATIREFIASDVLKACITSVHDPYFVDLQKDLAQLIASIWIDYGALTGTPRRVVLSLPGMEEQRVVTTEAALMQTTTGRRQKALVLDLLEDLRGVSISEQGRITSREERRKMRSALAAQYMTLEMEGQERGGVDVEDGPDLTGVADMFS